MTTRRVVGAYGRAVESGVRVAGDRGNRPAASGIPTVYTSCQELTKRGQVCGAPNVGDTRTCAGHARKLNA